jgi:hypothetical protein
MWLSGRMCLYPPRGASGGGPTDSSGRVSSSRRRCRAGEGAGDEDAFLGGFRVLLTAD